MITTLVLTRKPNKIFQSALFPSQSGRFGTLIVLGGPKVTKVGISTGQAKAPAIAVPAGTLDVATEGGGPVKEVARYTTIERMNGFVQLKPQEYKETVYKHGAYGISYESGNAVVAKLAGTDGNCFRVLGGMTAKERAILLHEAPHVGWLIGCIGPRKLNDFSTGSTETAHKAMAELFGIRPAPSALFVVDW